MYNWSSTSPQQILDFWFPQGLDASGDTHRLFFRTRMKGGMHEEIRTKYAQLTRAAAEGDLDSWMETLHGRLALVVVLDQFSRSIWEGSPAAYGQDLKAARLALSEVLEPRYEDLRPWEKTFLLIAIGHCEGPQHLDRMDIVLDKSHSVTAQAPEAIKMSYKIAEDQARLSRDVIASFGRYPHRNVILGRISTKAEESYIARGEFPHLRVIPLQTDAAQRMLDSPRNAVTGNPE
jgi:uncharacterized protein (DUF924 family)